MDLYNEIHISNIKKKPQMKMYGWTEDSNPGPRITSMVVGYTTVLSKPINIHGPSRPNYHIPPLTKFLPSKNTH